MGDPKTVLEGNVKYRDKKKWKSRWAVVSKLSPVADCLHIQLYRDSKERCKNGPTKASLSLEGFLGLESGFTLDKESNTMAIVCQELVVVLAFDSRELLIQWQVKIRANLVEEQQFLVQLGQVPPKSKLPCGPARLHLQDHTFSLVSGVPPRLLGIWPIKELRRFGVVEGKFCFEGGSLCGKGEGLHVLLTNQCEELSHAMDLASQGKLQGKRKTLSRKNSVLETSSGRMPLHSNPKRCSGSSSKSSCSSSRPLLSCSDCDACSENNMDMVYSASMKAASSCGVHYRWPSCASRWGQSSTTTASDIDSVDTVSVMLSDFQGSSISGAMSMINGQSLSCLCDSQGTWPFNNCGQCGRQFYSHNSLQSCKNKPNSSPEHVAHEETSGFSPQWTMDTVVGSHPPKKDSAYQMMNPPCDRSSLCSRASHSSSTSAGSSGSGSEYSVPKNFMEMLYDKPKNMQHAVNGVHNTKFPDLCRPNGTLDKPCKPPGGTLCPCHRPTHDWMSTMATSHDHQMGHPDCACWNQLAMRNDTDTARQVNGCAKSASANVSPNSSPKKMRYNTTLRSLNSKQLDCETCSCSKEDPHGNYAIPKSAVMHPKDVPVCSAPSVNGSKDAKYGASSNPTEDYDVPKKFTDLLSNCDMTQKSSAMKSIINNPSCSCMNACNMVQNLELLKMASKHSNSHQHGAFNHAAKDALQMCACQRVMLWAGSLVPCLGPQPTTLETGWQCTKSLPTDGSGCRSRYNHINNTVCHEPHRTAEVVMVNGKLKHVLRDSSTDLLCDTTRTQPFTRQPFRPRANTVSYSFNESTMSDDDRNADSVSCNYANLDFEKEEERIVKVSDDGTGVNYANIEFAETLSLYENSNLVLSRLEAENKSNPRAQKPPLPPRSQANVTRKPVDCSEVSATSKCKQISPLKVVSKHLNGSSYEIMCYQQNRPNTENGENYLLMQPASTKENESVKNSVENCEVKSVNDVPNGENTEAQSSLPLRPFMPISYPYPISENDFRSDSLSRKHQLINEDLQMRAMRSNSLSELKKKVLIRKRSCSVDGKNNGYISKDSGTESVPASPVGSPRQNGQRKHSLFAKLNLRSKEKSMSTNEIILSSPLRNVNYPNIANSHKSGFHRSADCLKLSDDFANSDEDLNSDNSDFVLQKETCQTPTMKRSSSVPCRAGMPSVTVTSPVRVNGTILELNDLNKEEIEKHEHNADDAQEPVQRKYSLDSHVRSKKVLHRANCDTVRQGLDETDAVMEMEGVLRRHHNHPSDRTVENYRSNTSSCSSSDISDYMESLSFISRSSSSSSGSTSSTDYMRTEDLYRTLAKTTPPQKIIKVHDSNNTMKQRESSSSDNSSSGSYHMVTCCRDTKSCGSVRCNRDSTSSTSSLSTSPSVTDYNSSSSSSPPPVGLVVVKGPPPPVVQRKKLKPPVVDETQQCLNKTS